MNLFDDNEQCAPCTIRKLDDKEDNADFFRRFGLAQGDFCLSPMLFVTNLSDDVNNQALRIAFASYHPLKVKVLYSSSGSQGRAAVFFGSEEQALAACRALNGTLVGTKVVRLPYPILADCRPTPPPQIECHLASNDERALAKPVRRKRGSRRHQVDPDALIASYVAHSHRLPDLEPHPIDTYAGPPTRRAVRSAAAAAPAS